MALDATLPGGEAWPTSTVLVTLPDTEVAMPAPTHQTVRLSRGRHTRSEQGACVMELASMLAGEPFSDHPAGTSPVIGAFLRAYNDDVDDERRQSLYRYAALVVGTRAFDHVERARASACTTWLEAMLARDGRLRWRRWRARLRGRRVDAQTPTGIARATGEFAATLVRQDGDRAEASVLELLDRLIALPDAPAYGAARPRETVASRWSSAASRTGGGSSRSGPSTSSADSPCTADHALSSA
jgi:hypothetical protein